jgi:hypothetical protein
MPDYLFLMHDDVPPGDTAHDDNWGPYIGRSQASGNFEGGRVIGAGICPRNLVRCQTLPPIYLASSALAPAAWTMHRPFLSESGVAKPAELWRSESCLGPSNISPRLEAGLLRGGRSDSHISR